MAEETLNTPSVHTRLPGANYAGKPSLADLEFESRVYSFEFLTRTQLLMGKSFHSNSWAYGIVDENDPATITNASSRPLAVKANASNALTIDIVPGIAVSRSGHIIIVSTNIGGRSLPSLELDEDCVVFARAGSDEKRRAVTRTRIKAFAIRDYYDDDDKIVIKSMSDFQSIYSDDDLNDFVVLAVITRKTSSLDIDLSTDKYSWNRPWFSTVDTVHRSKKGTGLVTENNPHGTSFNDLTYGDFTVLDLMTSKGFIVARDRDVRGVPGHLCYEQLSGTSVETDLLGLTTGVPFCKYFFPNKYPHRILLLRQREELSTSVDDIIPGDETDEDAGEEIVSLVNYGSPHVVIPWNDKYFWKENPIEVAYTAVDAASVSPILSASTQIEFNQPASDEVIISEGMIVNELTQPIVSLEDCTNVNKMFTFYVDGNGVMRKDPEVIMQETDVSNLSAANTLDIQLHKPFHLEVALKNPHLFGINQPWATHQNPVIKLEVAGTLLDGTQTTKEVTCKFASARTEYWDTGICIDQNPVGPDWEGDYHQFFLDIKNVWTKIDSVYIKENVTPEYVASGSKLVCYGRLARSYSANRLNVGIGWWDGAKICRYQDIRQDRTYFNVQQVLSGVDPLSNMPSSSVGLQAGPNWAAPLNTVDGIDYESFIAPKYKRINLVEDLQAPSRTGMYIHYKTVPVYIPVSYCTKILVFPVGGSTFRNKYQDFVSGIEYRWMNTWGKWSSWSSMTRFDDRVPFIINNGFFRIMKAFQIKVTCEYHQAQNLQGLVFAYYKNDLTQLLLTWFLSQLNTYAQSLVTGALEDDSTAAAVAERITAVDGNATFQNTVFGHIASYNTNQLSALSITHVTFTDNMTATTGGNCWVYGNSFSDTTRLYLYPHGDSSSSIELSFTKISARLLKGTIPASTFSQGSYDVLVTDTDNDGDPIQATFENGVTFV